MHTPPARAPPGGGRKRTCTTKESDRSRSTWRRQAQLLHRWHCQARPVHKRNDIMLVLPRKLESELEAGTPSNPRAAGER
eukprot:11426028-Alexandrium_andersonii.AAC.1